MTRQLPDDLLKFLEPFPAGVIETAIKLREMVIRHHPDCNELIYDNYNALAIGYSITDKQNGIYTHIAVYSNYVNLGFNRGTELNDPDKLLKGTGKKIRHYTVHDFKDLPKPYVLNLLDEALHLSQDTLNLKSQQIKGLSVVKSISPKKRRPL